MKDEDIFNLIKKNANETLESPSKSTAYYLKSFKKMLNGIFVFNLGAFLFGTFWMLYRKMYLLGFLVFLLTIYLPVPYIVTNTLLGFSANYLYYIRLKDAYFDEVKHLGVNRWIGPMIILAIMATIMAISHAASNSTPEFNPSLRIA